ncbi:hypothetical protein BGE01nite_23510 [Brevifollis gellanilyticus]|uniref:Uncharacterized protein n=1 Tax=Brevifollis gellanilyticus TaxID=748831 RepID=A0A512M8I6_9BACT|nr:hypothetical protein BGE01nite_23510 [Brevifollis gellanilyticus]
MTFEVVELGGAQIFNLGTADFGNVKTPFSLERRYQIKKTAGGATPLNVGFFELKVQLSGYEKQMFYLSEGLTSDLNGGYYFSIKLKASASLAGDHWIQFETNSVTQPNFRFDLVRSHDPATSFNGVWMHSYKRKYDGSAPSSTDVAYELIESGRPALRDNRTNLGHVDRNGDVDNVYYVIKNDTASAVLGCKATITSAPGVSLVSSSPATLYPNGGGLQFQIIIDPSVYGAQSFEFRMHDSSNAIIYSFPITFVGSQSEISVTSNGLNLADGTTTPTDALGTNQYVVYDDYAEFEISVKNDILAGTSPGPHGPLTLSSILFSGTNGANFNCVTPLPVIIQPLQTEKIVLRGNPLASHLANPATTNVTTTVTIGNTDSNGGASSPASPEASYTFGIAVKPRPAGKPLFVSDYNVAWSVYHQQYGGTYPLLHRAKFPTMIAPASNQRMMYGSFTTIQTMDPQWSTYYNSFADNSPTWLTTSAIWPTTPHGTLPRPAYVYSAPMSMCVAQEGFILMGCGQGPGLDGTGMVGDFSNFRNGLTIANGTSDSALSYGAALPFPELQFSSAGATCIREHVKLVTPSNTYKKRTVFVGGFTATLNGNTYQSIMPVVTEGVGGSYSFVPDPEFTPPTVNGYVRCVEFLRDGDMLIGGTFTTVNGQSRPYLARLNYDGSLDTTNGTNGVSGLGVNMFPDGRVDILQCNESGDVLICGEFTSFSGSNLRESVAVVSQDGSGGPVVLNLKPFRLSFLQGTQRGAVYCAAIQADGRVFFGGAFTKVLSYGLSNSGTFNKNNIVKISDYNLGKVDDTFKTSFNDNVMSLAIDHYGRLHVGGLFTKVAISPGSTTTYPPVNVSYNPDGSAFGSAVLELTRPVLEYWTAPAAPNSLETILSWQRYGSAPSVSRVVCPGAEFWPGTSPASMMPEFDSYSKTWRIRVSNPSNLYLEGRVFSGGLLGSAEGTMRP